MKTMTIAAIMALLLALPFIKKVRVSMAARAAVSTATEEDLRYDIDDFMM